MLQGLSLLPSLAVAGVTTSVSLATAMGGVQSLPTSPDSPPHVQRMAAVQAVDTPAPVIATPGTPSPDAVVPTEAPAPTPAPTTAPTQKPVVVATAPKPATAPPPPPPPPPAPAKRCTTWLDQGWTITWCAATTPGGPTTWTATNGSQTQSGTWYGMWSPTAPGGYGPWTGNQSAGYTSTGTGQQSGQQHFNHH